MESRAAALDMARIMSWEVHMQWMELLIRERFARPMAGYKNVTFEQMMAADLELWTQLAELTGEGVRVRPDGFLPCDVHYPEAAKSRRVDRALTTKPKTDNQPDLPSDGAGGGQARGSSSGSQQQFQLMDQDDNSRKKKRKRPNSAGQQGQGNQRNHQAQQQAANTARVVADVLRQMGVTGNTGRGKGGKNYNGNFGGKGGNPGGKGVNGNGKKGGKVPRQLLGMPHLNAGGQTCYAFNIEGCVNESRTTPGDKCPNGFHRCPKCGGPHSLRQCTA